MESCQKTQTNKRNEIKPCENAKIDTKLPPEGI